MPAQIALPTASANRAIKDRSAMALIQRTTDRWKPEAMYFSSTDGRRVIFIVFDLPDPASVVVFSEPFYTELDADVLLFPVMNGDDLQRGFAQLG